MSMRRKYSIDSGNLVAVASDDLAVRYEGEQRNHTSWLSKLC